ncbi:MAG: NADH-quinone oxidoreductase subunit L [Acidimicrobiales bacterium]
MHAAYLILLFPFAGFLVLAAFGRKLGNPLAGWLATAAVLASFVTTLVVFVDLLGKTAANRSVVETAFTWFQAGTLRVNASLLVDPLSMTMALFVTGVSTLIHLYSIGYMEHDEQFAKFFVYMNLFVTSMLLLVLGGNMVLTFLGWEGVGVCSYFLIAFWFDRASAASAGKKAMIYNRIGDAGFLVAMFLTFEKTGSLDYVTVFSRVGHLGSGTLTAIGLLLFLGACGKSAQLPLYPWLADAMEGPTPVSALIHAATMVTAGVYLMCRINPILHAAPDAAHVVAWIGAITALLGATVACGQQDIKKILAYSTISQLGYMFLACGVGAYVAAIFLMLTHAFYKALLFLGAGSVIHAMDDEQDTKRYGALAKAMPITSITFLVAWLAIGGVPPLSGFFSKGDVLENAYGYSPILYGIGAFTAILTAYYLGRCYMLTFRGKQRWVEAKGGHGHSSGGLPEPHDARWEMSLPLVVLAIAAVFAGLLDFPFHIVGRLDLERWLDPVVGHNLFNAHRTSTADLTFACVDAVLALVGVAVAVGLWRAASERRAVEPAVLQRAWYIDAGYDAVIARGSTELADATSSVVETKVIDGAVTGLAALVAKTSVGLRKVQTGYVRSYALALAGGLVVVLAYVAVRVGS